ncbi:MAG TPA: hypothetical protein DCL29_02140 [Eubacterium sp.]|nr:hypothetical protein [Eubacterium sp.]
MLQGYSENINVATNATIPFNNVSIEKGCTARLDAPGSIQLNKSGVYMVSVDAAGTPTAAGVMSIQLSKDGVLQPQAQSAVTGATTDIDNMSFLSLVQVKQDNTCNCCSSPTFIRVINTGVPVDYVITNIVVTKVC